MGKAKQVIVVDATGSHAPALEAWPEYDDQPTTSVTAGDPKQSAFSVYSNETGSLQAGVWLGTSGSVQVTFELSECCYILEGRLRLVADDGTVSDVGPGQILFTPAGWSGVWEIIEPIRKVYVLVAE